MGDINKMNKTDENYEENYEEGYEEQGESIKSIHIEVMADGTYSVGVMDSELEQAGTMYEALDMARLLLEDDGTSEEDQVMKGYESGQKPKAKVTPEEVFGE